MLTFIYCTQPLSQWVAVLWMICATTLFAGVAVRDAGHGAEKQGKKGKLSFRGINRLTMICFLESECV